MMVWMWALSVAAEPVLLVPSPGIRAEAYSEVIRTVRASGHEVQVFSWSCIGKADVLRQSLAEQAQGRVVVAHGLGATLALQSQPEVHSWVLMAPVLAIPDSASMRAAIEQLPSGPVNLAEEGSDGGARDRLLGPGWSEWGTCVAPDLIAQMLSWADNHGVIPGVNEPGAPVWIGVSLLDEMAPPELVIPLSRQGFPRSVTRIGVTGLDAHDRRHLELLHDPAWLRAVKRALKTAP